MADRKDDICLLPRGGCKEGSTAWDYFLCSALALFHPCLPKEKMKDSTRIFIDFDVRKMIARQPIFKNVSEPTDFVCRFFVIK